MSSKGMDTSVAEEGLGTGVGSSTQGQPNLAASAKVQMEAIRQDPGAVARAGQDILKQVSLRCERGSVKHKMPPHPQHERLCFAGRANPTRTGCLSGS
jgi:hypothetical protein